MWTKGCTLHFHKKVDLGIAMKYRGTTLTSTVVRIYNGLLLNHIKRGIEKILRKNQILPIHRILERVRAKILIVILFFVDFSKVFDSIHKVRWTKYF